MTYQPAPFNTDDFPLPERLTPLVEQLAANAHDVWARARLDQGWVWGPARDDERKCHPCLVPFGELPESEQDLDREMVREVVKGILLMGYRVIPAREAFSRT